MKNLFQSSDDAAQELFIDPLDALLETAVREQSRKSTRVLATPSKDDKPLVPVNKLTGGFYLPVNWKLTRTISLIHQPSNTLLGNFNEFTYIPNPKTRKLTRVEAPVATDGTEFVTGEWWLQMEAQHHAEQKSWIESRSTIIGISLHECGLHCDAAEVIVRLEHGYIARVELSHDTRFTCAARNSFLILHAGLDVLEAMSFDCKIALKSELHIGEEE